MSMHVTTWFHGMTRTCSMLVEVSSLRLESPVHAHVALPLMDSEVAGRA